MGFQGGIAFGGATADNVTLQQSNGIFSIKDSGVTSAKIADATIVEADLDTTNITSLCPIGTILPWLKSYTNTPSIPTGWVECDGSTLSDSDSVYDGQTLPDLNGDNSFLRGSSTSGSTGGSETHTHSNVTSASGVRLHINGTGFVTTSGSPASNGNSNSVTSATSTLPTYYEVVYIMRVK